MPDIARLIRDSRPRVDPDRAIGEFWPDQDGLGAWAHRTFIAEDGPLANLRHEHLRDAAIGWLWANAIHASHGRTAAGMCKLVPPPQDKWPRAMADWQLRQWFGEVPDVLITISAVHAAEMDDWAFCALVEHELCHAGQAVDEFGTPRFHRDGRPMLAMIGHDVEEFVDVVARYGADATGTRALVTAANAGPSIGQAQISAACGTCTVARRA